MRHSARGCCSMWSIVNNNRMSLIVQRVLGDDDLEVHVSSESTVRDEFQVVRIVDVL